MENAKIKCIIEAILFVAGEPVCVEDLAHALDLTVSELSAALDQLRDEYDLDARGVRLARFGDSVQLTTRAEYAPYIERLLQPVQKQTLSQAALETLAIIAYRQPITRLEVEEIRGVKCDYSIQMLAARELICEVGRKDTLGHPILYGTTDAFLAHFGIASLEELPSLEPDRPAESGELPI